jgi:hypothetical protein
MHSLLSKLLKKRNIESVIDLSGEEKTKFDEWNSILSKDELNAKDIALFCETQVVNIENRWKNELLDCDAISRLVQQHIVYKQILVALGASKEEKRNLEKYLTQLVDSA